ncbi:hypothetical protein ABZ477_17660 [Microbacterium sp. NPDC019599]|uniref:hypothetical protein n=1 Tax=Microbacterium sp. NPDC019599 TaxID=3154690 RepID=UPI0033E69463
MTFEVLAEPPIPEWIVRVTVTGTGFTITSMPSVARVGSVPVEGVLEDAGGLGFIGYLREVPADGAHLFVGKVAGALQDTGFAFEPGIV